MSQQIIVRPNTEGAFLSSVTINCLLSNNWLTRLFVRFSDGTQQTIGSVFNMPNSQRTNTLSTGVQSFHIDTYILPDGSIASLSARIYRVNQQGTVLLNNTISATTNFVGLQRYGPDRVILPFGQLVGGFTITLFPSNGIHYMMISDILAVPDTTSQIQSSYWSPWLEWGPCNPSTKTMLRHRQCMMINNQPCVGENKEEKMCPVDGSFSEWSEWSQCSPCGGSGNQKRTRTYIPAQHGGTDITGPLEETRECVSDPCPTDGYFTPWTEWSGCNAYCGPGRERRERQYIPATWGGKNTEGPLVEFRECIGTSCGQPAQNENLPQTPSQAINLIDRSDESVINVIIPEVTNESNLSSSIIPNLPTNSSNYVGQSVEIEQDEQNDKNFWDILIEYWHVIILIILAVLSGVIYVVIRNRAKTLNLIAVPADVKIVVTKK